MLSTSWPTSTGWPPWRHPSTCKQDGPVRLARLLQPLRRGLGVGENAPLQWTKQVASHWGGTRNGTIVTGPRDRGTRGLRTQFTHVIDVAPTILEAAGLPEPTMVNGVQQSPMEGTSMLYSFNDGEVPNGTICSTSRCSATAASTTRAGARSPSTRLRGSWSEACCRRSTTTSGSSTTAAPTSSTRCCPLTTEALNGSTRTSLDGRR